MRGSVQQSKLPGEILPLLPSRMQWDWQSTCALTDSKDLSSAKISSPAVSVCCNHSSRTCVQPWRAGEDQPEDFVIRFFAPITKFFFYPLVLTSVHFPVFQIPFKTARTEFLKFLIDFDMLSKWIHLDSYLHVYREIRHDFSAAENVHRQKCVPFLKPAIHTTPTSCVKSVLSTIILFWSIWQS